MTRIKKSELAEGYSAVRTNGFGIEKGRNDCAVVAVSIACGVAYEYAHATMKLLGRVDDRATANYITRKALDHFGFDRVTVDMQEILNRYPLPHCNVLKNVTTHHPRRFPGTFDSSKVYLFQTSGHILAMRDGIVHDWSVNNSLRVLGIEEIIKRS